MKSIRRYVYAAVLTLSALNFLPSLASAQEARGRFTLTHEVHWQNAVVPAGEYQFSLESKGPSELLLLRKIDGGGAGIMMLANDAESATSELSRLVLVSRPGGSFVSAMELPEVGLTLHFAVPAETREVAQAGVISAASSAR